MTRQSSTDVGAILSLGVCAATVCLVLLRARPQPKPCTPTIPSDSRTQVVDFVLGLQDHICKTLEDLDGGAKFHEDLWEKTPKGSGGGRTRVISNGNIFEQGGVNVSQVTSHQLPPTILVKHPHLKGQPFFATGISIVLHPKNPFVPTVHMNYRYFETGTDDKVFWFGGGCDLTPYYLEEGQAQQFHQVLKDACDKHDPNFYSVFKFWCDEYFHIKHRQERRGLGGIFFDYQDGTPGKSLYVGPDPKSTAAVHAKELGDEGLQHHTWAEYFAFVKDMGNSFLDSYLPIVRASRDKPYTDEHRQWQLYRRGRYVEFNLVYDRGTTFGLQTPGSRTESILMSLPPMVRWEYCYPLKEEEERLVKVLREPIEWVH